MFEHAVTNWDPVEQDGKFLQISGWFLLPCCPDVSVLSAHAPKVVHKGIRFAVLPMQTERIRDLVGRGRAWCDVNKEAQIQPQRKICQGPPLALQPLSGSSQMN